MSDILIRGMEMPDFGERIIILTSSGYVEDVSGAVIQGVEAIPIPPHGRLGDLDKLENGLRHMAKYQHGERQQGILGCCETIRLAPTIIQASE